MSGSTNGKNRSVIPVLVRRELTSFYQGPVAYIVSGLFIVFSGLLFFSTFFLMNRAELRGFFSVLPILFSFFIPALTMRTIAEERRSGTIETLLTLPVSAFEAVMAKYLASLATVCVLLVPSLAYLITVSLMGDPDPGPIAGGYLGALFLASAFVSIGIYASSVTKNQIIAFFIAFTAAFVLSILDQVLVILPAGAVSVLSWLSAGSHFDPVSRGIMDTRDLLYFVSLTAVFLSLAVKTVQERREV